MSDGYSRRRFLGEVGAASVLWSTGLAGCSALPIGYEGDSADRIAGSDLRSIATETIPDIPRTIPVEIEPSYVTSTAERVRSHLASVPTPLSETEVPNGAIRAELNTLHDRTRDLLEAADSASTPFEALETLRRARGEARTLSAAWEAIDDGLSDEALAERVPEIEDARAEFIGRWRYVGEDPIRATVVHATLEQYVASARRLATSRSNPRLPGAENVLDLGEYAGDLERGVATLEDAGYCYDRFTDSLADPTNLLVALEGSARALVNEIARRRSQSWQADSDDPSDLVDQDVSDTPAAMLLERFHWDIGDPDYAARERSAGRPARAIVIAHGVHARFDAFESLREEINDGETFAIETAADVRERRSSAVDALDSARSSTSVPALSNQELSGLSRRLADADEQLTRYNDDVRPDRLDRVVADYVAIRAIAAALPEAGEAVARVLNAHR